MTIAEVRLMAHPLELSYNWRTPVLFATVGAFVCVAVLVRGRSSGWIPALRPGVGAVGCSWSV